MREVYGIRRVQFNEKDRTVRVEFDASRLKQDAVAKLLRQGREWMCGSRWCWPEGTRTSLGEMPS